MKTRYYYEKTGALSAYMEILRTGIRDICIPNYGEANIEALDYIDEEAKKNGFCTMLITYNRIRMDGSKFKTYQKIIYQKDRMTDARELKEKIQKSTKGKDDHREIGRLLGYGQKAIESFIN